MSMILQTVGALLSAGIMMLSEPLETAAPQNAQGDLMLANRQWCLSEHFEPEVRLANVSGQVRGLQPHVAAALEEMFAACKKETGVRLVSVSGYRNYGRQVTIYSRKLKRVRGNVAKADEYVARPGASEHQTGLTMDIGQRGEEKNTLGAGFANTKGGKWIRNEAWRFGFVLRYDKGWEEITGYSYEPWHIRYVGKEHAARIHELGVPLETYLLMLRENTMLEMLGE